MKFIKQPIAPKTHLTLSVILREQGNEIRSAVHNICTLLSQGLEISEKVQNNTIYRYPEQTIHFSLVHFLSDPADFTTPSGRKIFETNHANIITKIEQLVPALSSRIIDTTIAIKNIYIADQLSSIALEAYLSQDIISFGNGLTNQFEKLNGLPKVKGNPPEDPKRFSVNIFRFFKDATEEENNLLYKRIETINQELVAKPLVFNLRELSLVVSDDFLANDNPVIQSFLIG